MNDLVEIGKRLNLDKDALGIHAYNWDYLGHVPGSGASGAQVQRNDDFVDWKDENCQNETSILGKMAPCGFDTHYPDFLPMRKGYEHYR